MTKKPKKNTLSRFCASLLECCQTGMSFKHTFLRLAFMRREMRTGDRGSSWGICTHAYAYILAQACCFKNESKTDMLVRIRVSLMRSKSCGARADFLPSPRDGVYTVHTRTHHFVGTTRRGQSDNPNSNYNGTVASKCGFLWGDLRRFFPPFQLNFTRRAAVSENKHTDGPQVQKQTCFWSRG